MLLQHCPQYCHTNWVRPSHQTGGVWPLADKQNKKQQMQGIDTSPKIRIVVLPNLSKSNPIYSENFAIIIPCSWIGHDFQNGTVKNIMRAVCVKWSGKVIGPKSDQAGKMLMVLLEKHIYDACSLHQKNSKTQWSYDKMLIDWVRSGRMEKHLALN